ncbi:hypothetical protein [Streptomyces sp. NBC_01190]|nr:hypothetical protein OG519_02775 [Streptomyces sp. NBC_01190]
MPLVPRFPRPGGGSVCELGRTFGGWSTGSSAATLCHRAYG